MIYRIDWVENKAEGWKVATLVEAIEGGKTTLNVSINKVDKKTGAIAFPNFDSFAPGSTVEGQLWVNPAGKAYLFAPKPTGQNTANKGNVGIKAAQERKAENIKEAQENKGHAIKVASAMRDATLLLIEIMKREDMSSDDMWNLHKALRERYLKEWSNMEKAVDVPFN